MRVVAAVIECGRNFSLTCWVINDSVGTRMRVFSRV